MPNNVAVIGAGPGGLVAARYLQAAGFTPVLFDQADGPGGQWRAGSAHSGIWPGMRTNSSRTMNAFGDLAYPPGTAVYPTAEEVGAYLARYAERFGLLGDARFGTRVEEVEYGGEGTWTVRSAGPRGAARTERFTRVVVASGRYHAPAVPPVPGLDGFAGDGGVTHTRDYRGPEPFRGRRVLVAGHSISALEIASELALGGAAHVVLASRRPRYVVQKVLAGVPADHLAFTRFAALAGEAFPPEAAAAALKAFVLRTSGHPAQFGAPAPADDIRAAGLTQSQHYLPLVAEGRVAPRPWMARVDGRTVHFTDGRAEDVDAIVFATGYALDLPFLGARVRAALRPDAAHLDLHHHTFHPDLPGLACVGLYELVGPYFPTVELQARWVAYAWGGRVPAPTREAMVAGLHASREHRAACAGRSAGLPMHAVASRFAREAGVEPDPTAWPELARALLFGPLSPSTYRLSGPDAFPEAAERVAADAAVFGAVPDAALTPEQAAQLRALAAACGDAAFTAFADQVAGGGVRAPDGAGPQPMARRGREVAV